MRNFEYYTPTQVLFGKDTHLQAGSLLKKYGAKKVLIHYGGQSAVRSGLISRAQLFSSEQLTELYRATAFFLEEGPEPEDKQMKALQEARTKIEYTVPDLQERLELSQEPEMNL